MNGDITGVTAAFAQFDFGSGNRFSFAGNEIFFHKSDTGIVLVFQDIRDFDLLFFAARTLAENGRNQAALEKYALFPDKSPYKVAVLLNTAELYGENGSLTKALELSRKAYDLAPELPEAQLCYADKLYKSGNHAAITEVVKLSSSPYRVRMKKLYIAGMEARIKATDAGKSPEKLRQLCKSLLLIDAYNKTALSGLQKVQASTMPEQKKRYRQDL